MSSKFEKFSERARKVLTLAQEEAQRFNHNYIGTEHILLGLVREGEGVAAKVLGNLGVELIPIPGSNNINSIADFPDEQKGSPSQDSCRYTAKSYGGPRD
jgi:ATP-dependent Clp protease ATP-binding subunit ClpA